MSSIINPYILNINYDADTVSFMGRAGIADDTTPYFSGSQIRTGEQLWQIIDTLIKDLKGLTTTNPGIVNFKNITLVCHPVLGENAGQCALDLFSALRDMPAFTGTWTFDGQGATSSGGSDWADAAWTPSEMDPDDMYFATYIGSQEAGTKSLMGFLDGGQGWAIHHASDTTFETVAGFTSASQLGDLKTAGLRSVNRVAGDGYTRINACGRNIRNSLQTAVDLSPYPFSVAYRNLMTSAGTIASLGSMASLKFGIALTRGLTEIEEDCLNRIIEKYQRSLGREYVCKRAYGYGDSITFGTFTTNTFVDSFFAQIANAKGWTLINKGIDGRSLMRAVPIDKIGGPNIYDDRVNWFIFDEELDALFSVNGIVNDTGLVFATYNPTDYGIQQEAIMDHLIDDLGWPVSRILKIGGTPVVDPTGWNLYYPGQGGIAPATEARYQLFKSKDAEIAAEKGTLYSNPSSSVTYAGADGLHPNTACATDICNAVLPVLSGI